MMMFEKENCMRFFCSSGRRTDGLSRRNRWRHQWCVECKMPPTVVQSAMKFFSRLKCKFLGKNSGTKIWRPIDIQTTMEYEGLWLLLNRSKVSTESFWELDIASIASLIFCGNQRLTLLSLWSEFGMVFIHVGPISFYMNKSVSEWKRNKPNTGLERLEKQIQREGDKNGNNIFNRDEANT